MNPFRVLCAVWCDVVFGCGLFRLPFLPPELVSLPEFALHCTVRTKQQNKFTFICSLPSLVSSSVLVSCCLVLIHVLADISLNHDY